jgi:selenocysteine lyase/cysteine desulfurase
MSDAGTMDLDVEGLRADTPGCGGGLIHLNNAGAGLMPRPVLESVQAHLTREATIGGYEAFNLAKDQAESLYASAAKLIGGKPNEIAYLENATRAWDAVFYAFDWQPGDTVVTARSEYNSNMIAFRHAEKRHGIRVLLAPDTPDGAVDPAGLEALLDDSVKLICLSHMPTNDGLVNPAEAVGAVAAKHGIPYLLDACQSVGHYPVDVAKTGCTMLSTTGRKFLRGPRGTGFLWVREDWIGKLDPPFLDNRAARWTEIDGYEVWDTARRFENWESFVAGRIGLGVALDYANMLGPQAIWNRVTALANRMRAGLGAIPGITVHDRGTVKSAIVTFSHKEVATTEIVNRLRLEHRINTSASDVQLTRTDTLDTGIKAMVRASPHVYNTEDEIDTLLNAVAGIVQVRK